MLAEVPGAVQFRAVRGHLASSALSDDERRLLVLGHDESVRLYDVDSRTSLGDEIFVGMVDGAALRGDGLEPAAAGEHGLVVWDLDPQRWMDAACELAGRNLTREEWQRYVGVLGGYGQTCPDLT